MTVLLALLLAAQDVAAPGPVEVEVGVDGTADVPAQGYRVSAAFYAGNGTPADARAKVTAAKAASVDALRPLGPIDRDVCAPSLSKFGFVGNAAIGGSDQEYEDPAVVPQVDSYEAVLADRQSAERALAALRGAGATTIEGPQAVLFDCAAGERLAEADVLVRSRAKAEPYARLLRRRIAGVPESRSWIRT